MNWQRVERHVIAGLLARVSRWSVQAGTHEAALDGCEFFALVGDRGPVFGMAARLVGDEFVIVAAAGEYAGDLTAVGLSLAEHEARRRGARSVAFQTRRRGLVKKSSACGYAAAGYIMRKGL